jgi:hypothetical protein
MMATKKLSAKAQDKANHARFLDAYNRTCQGIQIPILKMGEVMQVGLNSIAEGDDDQVLGEKVRAFVESIRQN